MKPHHLFSLVLAANTIAWSGQARAVETHAEFQQTWATISNHWGSIQPTRTKQAAEQGDLSAQYYLGESYFNGIRLVQDQNEALKWIQSAGSQGLAAAEHNLGWRYAHGDGVETNESLAIAWYQKAADQGFVKSQINLGWMYARGDVDKRDYDLAEKWLRKAAEQGSAEAQYQFGNLWTEEFSKSGKWVANFQVAAEWYRKAADQGYDKAQYKLAELYNYGKLGDDQRSNCIPWFLKAAAQGNTAAQAKIGELPSLYPHSELLKSAGIVESLRQSAAKGNLEAQLQLAKRYQSGDGVPKDLTEAFRWMQLAAQHNPSESGLATDAHYCLAQMYENGEGVAQNLPKAYQLYQETVVFGLLSKPDPEFRLGQMYEKGEGVPQSDLNAVTNYFAAIQFGAVLFELDTHASPPMLLSDTAGSQAAESILNLYIQGRGLPDDKAKIGKQIIDLSGLIKGARGCFLVGEVYYQGKLVPKDNAQAADWFSKAATQGSPEAMNRIGGMWAAGMNGAPDPNEAANWYHKAATQGLAEAQYNLGLCYAKGAGVPTNPVEAWKWLQLAAKQKLPNATEERDKVQVTLTADQLENARTLADQFNADGNNEPSH